MITKFNNYSESVSKQQPLRGLKRNLKNPDYQMIFRKHIMTRLEILKTMTNEMPDELLEFIWSWDYIKKSPYSQSWYNAQKGWDGYIDGKLRVADHWNFEAQGKLHCETKQEPKSLEDKWYVGVYDSTDDKFDIVKSYDKKDKNIGSKFRAKEFKTISSWKNEILTERYSSPDYVDGYEFGLDYDLEPVNRDALSFVYDYEKEEWIFGEENAYGKPHRMTSNIMKFDYDSDSFIDKGYYDLLGRIWRKRKIIIFWTYPDAGEEFLLFIESLENRLKEKVWDNGWRIITLDSIIPIEEYNGSEDFSDELRQKHVAKWQDREKENKEKLEKGEDVVPKGWGSKSFDLPKDMTPAQYKHLKTFSENVNTSLYK